MYLFVLVIRLFAGLIGGLISGCVRLTAHSAQLVGVLVRDDRQVRARRATAPLPPIRAGHWVALGFFVFMFLLIAYAAIRY